MDNPLNGIENKILTATTDSLGGGNSKKTNIIFIIIGASVFLLLFAGMFGFMLYLSSNPSSTTKPTPTPTIQPTTIEKPTAIPTRGITVMPTRARLATATPSPTPKIPFSVSYRKQISATQSASFLYTPSTKKSIELSLLDGYSSISAQLSGEQTHEFGPWSPTGEYLPVLITSDTESNLYLISSSKQSIALLYAIPQNSPLTASIQLFSYTSRWISPTELIFSSSVNPETKQETLATISLEGKFQMTNRANLSIYGNGKISIYEYVSGTQSAVIRISTTNTSFRLQPKGKVFGISSKSFFSLEAPAYPNLANIRPDLLTTDEGRRIVEAQLMPTINANIYEYATASAQLVQTTEVKSDGWITIEAQVRPKKGTIIVHQQDHLFTPMHSRYLEITPGLLSNTRLIVSDDGVVDQSPFYSEHSFEITADGQYLIGSQPSASESSTLRTYTAWNIDNPSQYFTICEDTCEDLRVYNPDKFSSW